MALGLFRQYLLTECHRTLLSDITEMDLQGWLAFLRRQPTSRGDLRAAGTLASYLRSARAFCQWCVHHTFLKGTPFAHLPLLQGEPSLLQLLEPEEWEGLLVACRPPGETSVLTERAATVRNQAMLWVLAETGMRASELCGLHLEDVDREQGILTVRGKGSTKPRQLPLGQDGLHALLSYLESSRPELGACVERGEACEEPLFLSEAGRPLTDNGIALLFGRLRKRAGITRKDVGASLLRDTFAMQYLQAGGDRFLLRELLGQEESAAVKRSLRRSEEAMEDQKQKKPDHMPR
jgi:site-specific recombinase XerD